MTHHITNEPPREFIRSEPEWTPTYTIDGHIKNARREMGERRWSELRKEWPE